MCASWIFIVCEQFAIHFHLNCPLTFCVNVWGQSNDSTSHVLSLFCHFFALSIFFKWSRRWQWLFNVLICAWFACTSTRIQLVRWGLKRWFELWNPTLCVCVCMRSIVITIHVIYCMHSILCCTCTVSWLSSPKWFPLFLVNFGFLLLFPTLWLSFSRCSWLMRCLFRWNESKSNTYMAGV